MKKLFVLAILLMFAVSFTGVVSAKTLISGKIYNSDFSETIPGAFVEVTCNGNVENTTSLDDGTYSVTYKEVGSDGCNDGDDLTVFATDGVLSGQKSGEIHNNVFDDWDLAIVNVPLVPEFGLFVGSLTILGALGIFFVIRRK